MLIFDQAIFCDDIRTEGNGKLIAIGIYAGNMLFDRFPVQTMLSMLAHFPATGPGDEAFTIVLDINGQESVRIEGTMTFASMTSGWVPIPTGGIMAGTPGKIAVSCLDEEGKKLTFAEINMVLRSD